MIYLKGTSKVGVSRLVFLLAVPYCSKVAEKNQKKSSRGVLENFTSHRCFPVNFAKYLYADGCFIKTIILLAVMVTTMLSVS